ncbi:MAG: hypothetical protein HC819_23995 [Cyclobacteriaceae bacterium]|nr:hypothetical protein [Cyclobacteriaceae bacterium]
MKRFLLLLIIAIATFLIFAFFNNLDVFQDIWLWLVGFAGLIIQSGKTLFKSIKSLFAPEQRERETIQSDGDIQPKVPNSPINEHLEDPFTLQMTLLRFHDDGRATLGLLYINRVYYCYTLEDTHREVKLEKETRIPAGTYLVDFNPEESPFTRQYQQQFPEWFSYHLEIKMYPISKVYACTMVAGTTIPQGVSWCRTAQP